MAAPRTSSRGWLRWLLGAALLGGVILVALRFADAQRLVEVMRHAAPGWLVVALALQLGTYAAEGEGWRVTVRAGGASFPRAVGWRASLVKLFVDQAVPSAGIGGTAVFARTLLDRGVPREIVAAAVVLDTACYYLAYVGCLFVALVIALVRAEPSPLMVAVAVAFIAVGVAIAIATLTIAGRRRGRLGERLARFRPLRALLELLEGADRALTRDAVLILRGVLWQAAVFALDAATLWACVYALGGELGAGGAFASSMMAALLRTVGVVPGGLGTWEAAAVLMLGAFGVDVAVALPATLLFRGFSFWLPLAAGFWLSRRLGHPA